MKNSTIEWTDHTFNPWIGCAKVSDGCKFCYAETLMDKRLGRVQWGVNGTRQRTSDEYWRQPFKWNRQAKDADMRQRVFCASLADVFEDRPELRPWRTDLFAMIQHTPWLNWLVLTKRPEDVNWLVRRDVIGGQLPSNVWIGTSVENQATADERISHLLRIPARVRFLSMEPLLGPVDLAEGGHGWLFVTDLPNGQRTGINWVIVGGESGHNARPMHPDWVRSIRDQCQAAGVPFFFKQWGEWIFDYYDHPADKAGWKPNRVGKKAAGRLLDNREWSEFPAQEQYAS